MKTWFITGMVILFLWLGVQYQTGFYRVYWPDEVICWGFVYHLTPWWEWCSSGG